MRRRAVAATVAASLFLALTSSEAKASGGTFEVVFCHELSTLFGGDIDTNNAFSARSFCNDESNASAVRIESALRAKNGRSARAFWEVDQPLALTGVSAEGRLRRADGYQSELFMADADGKPTRRVAFGGPATGEFETYEREGDPQAQFVAELKCTEGPSCPPSPQAQTLVRDLRFTVADYADPQVEVEGSLLHGGWLRGEKAAEVLGTDVGSGLRQLRIQANSSDILNHDLPCGGQVTDQVASGFRPCSESGDATIALSTSSEPFSNGVNALKSCATDFAGNSTCESHEIRIDNEQPMSGFAPQAPDDPELIRAPVRDDFSGLASGAIYYRIQGTTDWRPLFTQKVGSELQARVDSAAEVPGTYEFIATATDVAGNSTETLLREDGTPMTLDFPLRSGVELDARIEPGGSKRTTVDYGRNARVQGRLLDAAGRPLAGKPIVVDENFGEGALIDHRIRTVTTDEDGRWTHGLPAGPTRSVNATYEGDQRYLDTDVQAGRMTVRTGARLGLSKKRVAEGRSTTFKGRIGRLGARIPTAGKLVQIQYQDPASDRWLTVRNPFRTKSNGRFSFRYGFGTHYEVDVAIRFRLNVPAEQGWPYRGAHTSARRVIVKARQ